MREGENWLQILDLRFQGVDETIASYLLWDGQEAALVETGPTSTLPVLLSALESAGVRAEQVTKLLLTHIHLDHAGAAGSLTRILLNATVHVHEAGARHLVDPSKLIQSATRIYGDDMERLWGEIIPVPAERLNILHHGERVIAGGQELQAYYTPGHASHHVAFWHEASRSVFTGDIGGVRLPGEERVLPPTPPPDLNLDAWSASLNLIEDLEPATVYLTHFGAVHDVSRHIAELRERLYRWEAFVLHELRAGKSEQQVAARLEELARQELGDRVVTDRYGLVAGYAMNVAGFARYFKQRGLLPS